MSFDEKTLFNYLRRAPFGRLTQQQVDGVKEIIAAWDRHFLKTDIPKLAYILATAYHETARTMAPVREGLAKTDKGARRVVKNYRYGHEVNGHVYYGRGYVQLTWCDNYRKMGGLLGYPLEAEPDMALVPDIAADVLILGMKDGCFTGNKLEDFFNDNSCDPVGARKIVNGHDKQHLIAGYFEQFKGALNAAYMATPLPKDATEAGAKPDGKPLAKDGLTLSSLGGMAAAGGAGFLGSINNPWAFAAMALVAVFVVLFLTGRLSLRYRMGA